MEKKIKKLKNSQVEVEIQLTDEEFKGYYQPIYDEALKNIELKGFRKGTAPKEMADPYLNKEKIFSTAVEEAVRFSLDEVKNENDWTLIEQPKIEVTTKGVTPGLAYKATLTLFPEVELPNYKKIAKEILSKKIKVELTDKEIEKTTHWILNSRATEARVNRASKNGDLLEIDLDAFHQEKAIPNSTFKKEKFILGDSKFIPGFDKALLGKKEGEEFVFKLEAPKDYWQKDYQSKELEFKGKIHSIFERSVPELNDEFVKTLGPSFQTVADFHKNMKEGLTMEKENKEKEKQQIEVLKQIAQGAKMDIPEILIERTLDSLVTQMIQNMGPAAEKQDPEQFKKELRTQLRKRAEENVASHLVIYKLAQAEHLEPTKEEVSAKAALHSLDVEKEGGYLYDTLQTQKVFTFLSGLVQPVEKEVKNEDNKEEEKKNKNE